MKLDTVKLRSVDMSALCKDLRDSIVLQENITDLPTLVDKYETELTRVLDIQAQEKKRAITVRPAATWYDGDIDREKRKRRKLEGAGANHAWLLTENYTRNYHYSQQESKGRLLLQHNTRNKGNQVLFNTVPISSSITLRS